LCVGVDQVFDGVGAGIFGVMVQLVTHDLSMGTGDSLTQTSTHLLTHPLTRPLTGRFNVMFGWINMCQQVGASLSNIVIETVVDQSKLPGDPARGYQVGFLLCEAIGVLPVLIYMFCMPETMPGRAVKGK
jgi:hypothetical protein